MSWWQGLQLWLSLSKKDWPGIIHRGSNVYFVHLQMKGSASAHACGSHLVSLGGVMLLDEFAIGFLGVASQV